VSVGETKKETKTKEKKKPIKTKENPYRFEKVMGYPRKPLLN
jgi:hypothetical protein